MKIKEKNNFTKLTHKKGISLILLIITIIVIIILAAVVILTLSKNNPIESAKEAIFKEDVRTFQDELAMKISKDYISKQGARDEKFNADKYTSNGEEDSIYTYIPSYMSKYDGKFKIVNDTLVYMDNSIEKENTWCKELGIKIDYISNPITDWEYTLDDSNNTVTLNKYVGTSKRLVIPEEYDINGKVYKVKLLPVQLGSYSGWGYPFTGPLINCLGYNQYEGNGLMLEEIILEIQFNTIEQFTFYGCSNLEKINIPDSVTSIGKSAFGKCSSLKSITLSENVISIENGAFSECSSLKSITMPEEVKVINNNVFYRCSNLEKVEIPDGVTSIGNDAFSYCSSLVNIEIPDTVATIGQRAFWVCTALESVVIPNGITVIENYTFRDCSSLKNVTLPNSVTSIKEFAFLDEASPLKNIYFNGTLEEWNNVTKDVNWKYYDNVVNVICSDAIITI